MASAPIKARFIVDHYDYQGKPFYATTDLSDLEQLGLPHNDKWHTSNIQVGTILTIEGRKFVIKDVMVCIPDEPYDFPGLDFNLEIRWYVMPAE